MATLVANMVMGALIFLVFVVPVVGLMISFVESLSNLGVY
jgi:hypothetical protein